MICNKKEEKGGLVLPAKQLSADVLCYPCVCLYLRCGTFSVSTNLPAPGGKNLLTARAEAYQNGVVGVILTEQILE